jgi:hypothetical protein
VEEALGGRAGNSGVDPRWQLDRKDKHAQAVSTRFNNVSRADHATVPPDQRRRRHEQEDWVRVGMEWLSVVVMMITVLMMMMMMMMMMMVVVMTLLDCAGVAGVRASAREAGRPAGHPSRQRHARLPETKV